MRPIYTLLGAHKHLRSSCNDHVGRCHPHAEHSPEREHEGQLVGLRTHLRHVEKASKVLEKAVEHDSKVAQFK